MLFDINTNSVHSDMTAVRAAYPTISFPQNGVLPDFVYMVVPNNSGEGAITGLVIDSISIDHANRIVTADVTYSGAQLDPITPRQARLKLLEVGLLDDLEAIISTNRAWQIEWEYATEVRRDSPLIDAIATQAGMTSEQIDQLFVEAAAL